MTGYWVALVAMFGLLAGAATVFDAWPAVAAAALGALITGRAVAASIRDNDEEEQ